MTTARLSEQLVEWLRSEVKAAGCEGLVFGLSGGVDSSTVAILARRACRQHHLALILPIHSDPRDREDAHLLVEQFQLTHREVSLSLVFDAFVEALGEGTGGARAAEMAMSNLKPRLRMAALYYFANRNRYLVVGTGNRSELTVGYFTKYGDGGVDLLPLGHLVKHEVRELAVQLGVPRSIVEKAPSAGMWSGQTDEAELGFSYQELDRYLVEGEGSVELANQVRERRRHNQHKLRVPKMPPSGISR
ncbi:MAG: NAD(+) synthase [Acidobacteriota bacterium]